jgi:hypothetical protein
MIQQERPLVNLAYMGGMFLFTSLHAEKEKLSFMVVKHKKKKKVHQNNFQVQFGNETLPYKLRICLNSLFPQGSHKPHNFIKCGNQKQH